MGDRLADALILRRAVPADGAALADIYAPYVRETGISFETEPPTAAMMAQRIAAVLAGALPWIVAEDGAGRIAGYAYAARFHPRHAYRYTVEPSVYVDRDRRGGGIGTLLYARLIRIVEEQGHRQAIALVTLPNAASVALHDRFGFHPSGSYAQAGRKFGQWLDVGLFQRALGAGAETPPVEEPLPLAACAGWRDLA